MNNCPSCSVFFLGIKELSFMSVEQDGVLDSRERDPRHILPSFNIEAYRFCISVVGMLEQRKASIKIRS